MSLSEKSRTAIYRGFSDVIDDPQAIEELLSYFPARDVEEPVTKDFLRAETAGLRAETSLLGGELRAEMSLLAGELRAEMSLLAGELRVELRDAIARQTQWLIGLMITLTALQISLITLLN
jgi:hypothetical protein